MVSIATQKLMIETHIYKLRKIALTVILLVVSMPDL